MNIYKNVTELIGNTKMLEAGNLKEKLGLKANIFIKLEYLNPTGSIKDRIAYKMIMDAIKAGTLKQGGTIIEPTSGNTGIGISSISTSLGFKSIIVMPETMSEERRALIKAYGAQIELTPGPLGMKGAIARAHELNRQIENSIILSQFDNKSNPQIHFETTGPEIYNDLDGNVDVLVAGIGTGGTISGISKYLKSKRNVEVYGIEPTTSPVITEGKTGPHKIQGIGAGFIPDNLDLSLVDKVYTISTEEAFYTADLIAKTEGVLLGISSGASIALAIKLASLDENEGKNIVAIAPDGGDRYLSMGVFK